MLMKHGLLDPLPQGTGKTTVAVIYGRILKELCLLSDGEVVYRRASQLVGDAVGVTSKKVEKLLEECAGKVLVIDEAYMLNDQQYGKQALDTLVGLVSGEPGEDIAVIMCGYPEKMDVSQFLGSRSEGLQG